MKITLAAASFAVIAALSGLSPAYAAGFNDQSAAPIAAGSSLTGRQDLRHVPVLQGFNQQSHISTDAIQPTRSNGSTPSLVGVHCPLAPRTGFNESNGFPTC